MDKEKYYDQLLGALFDRSFWSPISSGLTVFGLNDDIGNDILKLNPMLCKLLYKRNKK